MHADMEKVLARFSQTNNVMVATVQCDGNGKQTCNGITSYPSIYYTPPGNAPQGQQTKYTGGHDYESMYRFIDQICGWRSEDFTASRHNQSLPQEGNATIVV